MPRYWILAVGALLAVDAWVSAATVKSPASSGAPLSGVDLQYVDQSVRPQDDLYRHLNGKWLDSFQIPADKGAYGAFTRIDDATQEQLRSIVEGLAASRTGGLSASSSDGSAAAAAPGADAQKIAD